MREDLHLEVAVAKKDMEFFKETLLRLERAVNDHKNESRERYDQLDKKIETKYNEIYEKIKDSGAKLVVTFTIITSLLGGGYMYFFDTPKEKEQKIENNQIELNKQIQEIKFDYLNKYHELKDFVLEKCGVKK
jgi:alkaline phosphatase